MTAKRTLICWDSSVLIEHLKGKTSGDPARIKAVEEVLTLEENNRCELFFSALIYPEVLPSNKTMPVNSQGRFEAFLQNEEKRQVLAADTIIGKKAQEIRNSTGLATPDAIHIATAIIYEADIFHTFDEDLLKLNGKPEVDGLCITKCIVKGETADLFPSG